MSSQHVVAVWECLVGGSWWSLGAPASTQLERARHKRLTRVLLADADPTRTGEHIDLRHMTMTHGVKEQQCPVRRSEFSTVSAAGKGVTWEWARGAHEQYDALPMAVQCELEESLASGVAVEWAGWSMVANGRVATNTGTMGTRVLRRGHSAPYPLARCLNTPPPLPVRGCHDVQHECRQRAAAQTPPTSESVSKERRHGLARQILHNLNIFNMSSKCPSEQSMSESSVADSRRHSVDTVSTYLSQESKEQANVVGDLLNCSVGSDEVFDNAPQDILQENQHSIQDLSVCVGGCIRAVAVVQWGAVCPKCMQPLASNGQTVALPCEHMLHLHCLYAQLQHTPPPLACALCGQVYPPGRQPPGTMAWCLHHNTNGEPAIRITYNFQSGIQSAHDPEPGARYFAVGFPRYTLLADTPRGRQMLSQLLLSWQRGELFRLARSQTTGRDLVVTWSHPLPPPTPHVPLLTQLT